MDREDSNRDGRCPSQVVSTKPPEHSWKILPNGKLSRYGPIACADWLVGLLHNTDWTTDVTKRRMRLCFVGLDSEKLRRWGDRHLEQVS